MLIHMRPPAVLALVCASLLCSAHANDLATETGDNVGTLTPAQITELISTSPSTSTPQSSLASPANVDVPEGQLNWQQWGEAEASARLVVDAPVAEWGFLPDALPDDYTTLAVLAESSAQAIANWRVFDVQGHDMYRVKRLALGRRQEGEASWYGPGFQGRKTASGETFNMHALSAAHRTLPLPSYVRVTNISNGKSVVVKINDRGPFHGHRIIDLSYAAARMLDMHGTAHVALEPVSGSEKTGSDRAGIPFGSEPAYQVALGNFADINTAQLLQTRLMKRLPPRIPVTLSVTPAPIVIHRVEVGPLASHLDVQVLIRSIRAHRMGFAAEPLSISPSTMR